MAIRLHQELDQLRRQLLTMGAAVEQRVRQAIDAVLKRDDEAAAEVRAGDDEIDRMEVEIEEECLRTIALTQPVAGDLRFVLAAMRISGDLERIADLALSVAKRAIDLHQIPPVDLPNTLEVMADQTRGMFENALSALADQEATLARRIRAADQRVDDLQKEVFAWVQDVVPLHVERTVAALNILSIARKLERIADISTNIAEEVIFLVEGTVVRHAPS